MMMKTIAAITIIAAGASADELYQHSLTSDPGWTVTKGAWMHDASGMSNAKKGENRAFVDVLGDRTSYAVEFDATLHKGKGWGVWLSASNDSKNKTSGYTFQYDPGWKKDSYLLRNWESNKESVLENTDLDVEYGEVLSFRFEVDGDEFRAFQDGKLIMQTDELGEHQGSLLGFRTWGGSVATFTNLAVSSVPAPSAGAIAMAGAGLLICGRPRWRRQRGGTPMSSSHKDG